MTFPKLNINSATSIVQSHKKITPSLQEIGYEMLFIKRESLRVRTPARRHCHVPCRCDSHGTDAGSMLSEKTVKRERKRSRGGKADKQASADYSWSSFRLDTTFAVLPIQNGFLYKFIYFDVLIDSFNYFYYWLSFVGIKRRTRYKIR